MLLELARLILSVFTVFSSGFLFVASSQKIENSIALVPGLVFVNGGLSLVTRVKEFNTTNGDE